MATSSSTQNNANAIYFDHITCNVCLEVLEDPVQCVKNEHHFCKKCITKHLARSKTCPVCQDTLTFETLRPTSRIVANLLQQFQSPKCKYASRGCTAAVRHESLLSHHDECGFAPVQCSHEGCEATVNKQDVDSHQQKCEFRSIACDDCHEFMKQREYEKHPCLFRKEIDENKHGLAEIQKILREIRNEQVRQGAEIQRLVRESSQPLGGQIELKQPCPTQEQVEDRSDVAPMSPLSLVGAACSVSSPTQSQATDPRQIFVAGGGSKSFEVFDWVAQKWTLYKDSLFFKHNDAFSFVYHNKMMICGGTSTNRVECVNVANDRSVSSFPARLPDAECGKGVLCGDEILTFGKSVSATSLKPPFKTTSHFVYDNGKCLDCYGVARVNENAVVLFGGYTSKKANTPCDKVLLYSPTAKCFENLAPLPYSAESMGVVVYKDNVIILGGVKRYYTFYDSVLKSEILNDALMYNVTNQQCRKLPSMLEKRSRCAAVIMGNTIVAIGGISENQSLNVKIKTAEYLVLGETSWKKLPPMHCERVGATACSFP